jgi:hypothetical protein
VTIDNIQNKDIGYAKSKRRIQKRNLDSDDLADRLDALQRAVANQRGDFERFRQEIIASVNSLLEMERERGSY